MVIAGYLVWLRSKYQQPVSPKTEETVQVTPTATPIQSASPSSTPGAKEATGSMKAKSATSPAMAK